MKAEDVVDEQERVGAGFVAEIFGHRQRGERHAKTRARRLVHLAEDHHGLIDDVLAGRADLGFLHLKPQVRAFTRALADAGEDGIAAVLLRDTRDQLLNDDGLAKARPAEESGLAAAKERREQVDHLDAGFEDFRLGRQVGKVRGVAMDRAALLDLDRAAVVDRIAQQIKHAPQGFLPHGYGQRPAGVDHVHAARHAVG